MTEEQFKKYRLLFWAFAALSVGTIAFILYNSMQVPLDSNARSHSIADFFRQWRIFENWLDDKSFHRLVRKTAHFTEYGLLGFLIGGAESFAHKIKGKTFISFSLLVPVVTAVTDEYIQSFVGRTSAVYDIVIDYSGALCGLLIMWGVSVSIKKIKHRKKQ